MSTFDSGLLDALSVPIGELIASVGRGVADAQRELDAASMASLRELYQQNEGLYAELQRIGYRPTWYHIPEAEGELQVALTVSGQSGSAQPSSARALASGARIKLYAAPVDAGYAAKYGFNLQATSKVRFRVVPVPPSVAAEALRVVPALVGLKLGEARERLAALGLPLAEITAADSATVTKQTPAPGTLLGPNDLIELEAS